MVFSVMQLAGAALLFMAGVCDCGRDWSNEEVVDPTCSDDQKDETHERYCCPTELRYSHPRVKMSAKGCDCMCGMAEEKECWKEPGNRDAGGVRRFYLPNGKEEDCCSETLSLGPHRRLVSEISECNCWCGKGEKEGESLFGPASWTRKLALRTLASTVKIAEDDGSGGSEDMDNAGRDSGDVALSLTKVGNLIDKKRKGRRNFTATRDMFEKPEDFKEYAAEALKNTIVSATEFIGHKPDDEEVGYLRKVITEYYQKKANSSPSERDKIPDFSEFVGPELMSLYMDKARAAMLSERDVREQSDKVVEKLIELHTAFRRKELAWDDRQQSFNDLLSHAEHYMKDSGKRREDQLWMGKTVARPQDDEPGDGWSPMDRHPAVPNGAQQPPYGKKLMYSEEQRRAEANGIYEGTYTNGAEPSLPLELRSNARPTAIVFGGKTVPTRCEIKRNLEKPESVFITWTNPESREEYQLRGIIRHDGGVPDGAITGRIFINDEPKGPFELATKPGQAPECGTKKFQEEPPRYCCEAALLGADRWLVTNPPSCNCYCGKFGA